MNEDGKFELLLKQFRGKKPSKVQLSGWKRAVMNESRKSLGSYIFPSVGIRWASIATALFVGFAIGAATMNRNSGDRGDYYVSTTETIYSIAR